jgi:hypothetical protein
MMQSEPFSPTDMWSSCPMADERFHAVLDSVPGLDRLLGAHDIPRQHYPVYKEMVLHALADLDVLTKELTQGRFAFSDPLGDMLDGLHEN